MILVGEVLSEAERAAVLERIVRARDRSAPWMTLGAFLLAACRQRSPASPAGLLTTIEDRALADLCESMPVLPGPPAVRRGI